MSLLVEDMVKKCRRKSGSELAKDKTRYRRSRSATVVESDGRCRRSALECAQTKARVSNVVDTKSDKLRRDNRTNLNRYLEIQNFAAQAAAWRVGLEVVDAMMPISLTERASKELGHCPSP